MKAEKIKPKLVRVLQAYGSLRVEQMAVMTGCGGDSIRRILRTDPDFTSTGARNQGDGMSWSYSPTEPKPKPVRSKESLEARSRWRQNGIVREEQRLKGAYITSVRLPWELVPQNPGERDAQCA
jgi:hypothetical protein